VAYCEHAKRKTVTVTDVSFITKLFEDDTTNILKVIFALRRLGRPIYGFDPETYDARKKAAVGAARRGDRY
jgi:histone H4